MKHEDKDKSLESCLLISPDGKKTYQSSRQTLEEMNSEKFNSKGKVLRYLEGIKYLESHVN
jgi:hypothetical protein